MLQIIQDIEHATHARREMTRLCTNKHFKKFGAGQRFRRGDFETQNPSLDFCVSTCNEVKELAIIKSVLSDYLHAIYEWDNVCKNKFGKSNPNPNVATIKELISQTNIRIKAISHIKGTMEKSDTSKSGVEIVMCKIGHVDGDVIVHNGDKPVSIKNVDDALSETDVTTKSFNSSSNWRDRFTDSFESDDAQVYWDILVEDGFLDENHNPMAKRKNKDISKNDLAYIARCMNEKLLPEDDWYQWKYFETLWNKKNFCSAGCNKEQYPKHKAEIDEIFCN